MAAKGFFVPMARSGRIPKKTKVKEEDKGEEGGCLLQVLGSREVDLVQKILNFLDPVCADYDLVTALWAFLSFLYRCL